MSARTMASVYTLRPTTREERGCVCPFSPGCAGAPCRSKGTCWEVRQLVNDRYAWATAGDIGVGGAARREENLARIATELEAARHTIRVGRLTAEHLHTQKPEDGS